MRQIVIQSDLSTAKRWPKFFMTRPTSPPIEQAISTLNGAKVKALILWAPEDAVGPAASHVAPLLKGLHAATGVEFPGAGHALPDTHARQLADPLRKFLDSLSDP